MGGLRTPTLAGSSRLRVLRPLFVKLHEWNARIPGAGEARPATILIGSHRLPVEPWERGEISRWPAADCDDAASRRCRLVMEALACMAKTMSDIERFESSHDQAREPRAELMLDCAIGMAVLKEVQFVIDRSVEGGLLEEAKHWGSLQHRLHRNVKSAMQPIAESEHPRVRQLADSLADPDFDETRRPRPPARPAVAEQSVEPPCDDDPEPPCEFVCESLLEPNEPADDPEVPVAGREARPSGRTMWLAVVCALSVSLWACTVWLPSVLRGTPPTVTLTDGVDADLLQGVTDLPPSLYVDVDAAAWDALTHVQKWQQVERVADRAEPHGRTGVLFRDGSGRPLAQWLRGRGIALLDGSTALTSPAAPLRPE